MIGRNDLIINQAQMTKAVEFYLKEKVFKEQNFKVIDVTVIAASTSIRQFKIDIKGIDGQLEKEDPGGVAHDGIE